MNKDVLCVTIDLKVLPLVVRNKIVNKIQKSNRRYSLENQEIKIDIKTLEKIVHLLVVD